MFAFVGHRCKIAAWEREEKRVFVTRGSRVTEVPKRTDYRRFATRSPISSYVAQISLVGRRTAEAAGFRYRTFPKVPKVRAFTYASTTRVSRNEWVRESVTRDNIVSTKCTKRRAVWEREREREWERENSSLFLSRPVEAVVGLYAVVRASPLLSPPLPTFPAVMDCFFLPLSRWRPIYLSRLCLSLYHSCLCAGRVFTGATRHCTARHGTARHGTTRARTHTATATRKNETKRYETIRNDTIRNETGCCPAESGVSNVRGKITGHGNSVCHELKKKRREGKKEKNSARPVVSCLAPRRKREEILHFIRCVPVCIPLHQRRRKRG